MVNKKRRESVWKRGFEHDTRSKLMFYVEADFICGFIQITRIENPFVTEHFMEIMHAVANVHIQQQCHRSQERKKFFTDPEVQALTFRSPSSLNDQVTRY